MALTLENMGLDSFLENDETFENFIGYCINKGRPLTGYSGGVYFMHHFGDAQICVRTFIDEENLKIMYSGIDSHEDSNTCWMLRVFNDITPTGSDILFRRVLFQNNANGEGILPIDIVNADVLESFLPDDVMELQMIGFPQMIDYFATEGEYMETCGEWHGRKLVLDDGTIVATGFLKNHAPDNEEPDDESDSYVLLRGTVKELYFGFFDEDTEEEKAKPGFIRCIIGTKYGDLEICHTIFQVDEAQRKNIKVGAIVSGVFVLSGDAAINERSENGAIFNEESDLRVLRQALEKGETVRLKTVLAENAEYISDGFDEPITGAEKIIERFDYVIDNGTGQIRTYMATLTNTNGDDELEYKKGKRCVLVSYDDGESVEQILFLDVNEEGKAERLVFSSEGRYTFKNDEVPDYSELSAEMDIDEESVRTLFERDGENNEKLRERILLNHLKMLCECYSIGEFEPLFLMMTDDVVFESQWVLTPNEGRAAVEDYFIGKGETLKKHNACPECKIVRLKGNVNAVEANASVNGDEPKRAKVGLWYPDGKLCMLMSQKSGNETVEVIVDLQLDERGFISRIDLCMPELFDFEPYEEDGV